MFTVCLQFEWSSSHVYNSYPLTQTVSFLGFEKENYDIIN